MIIAKELVVSNKKKTVIEGELRTLKFTPFPKNNKKAIAVAGETEQTLDDEDAEAGQAGDYDYLLGMAIWSLTAEKVSWYRPQGGRQLTNRSQNSSMSGMSKKLNSLSFSNSHPRISGRGIWIVSWPSGLYVIISLFSSQY
jgi:hypothetical protein